MFMMISTWVRRWIPALTSSWHLTMRMPCGLNTRFASIALKDGVVPPPAQLGWTGSVRVVFPEG